MNTVADLLERITKLKKDSREFYTNLYMLPSQLENLILKENTQIFIEDHVIVIIEKEHLFFRLHYYAGRLERSMFELKQILQSFSNTPIVMDIIEKDLSALKKINEYFLNIGFHQIETLVRMQFDSAKASSFQDDKIIQAAQNDDALVIEQLLYQTFNPYISRLPTKEEISKMIKKEEILLYKKNDMVAGLSIFKQISKNRILLDQLLTNPSFRNQGVANKLIESGIVRNGIENSFYLWAHTMKSNVVHFYENRGFRLDGLKDYIFLYQKGK